MEQKVTDLITHMAHSHQQMARVLDAERQIAVRLSQIVHALPDEQPDFDGIEGLMENTGRLNKSLISYLNAIADLQEAMAENLTHVMKELKDSEDE